MDGIGRKLAGLAIAGVLALGAAGCGDDDDDGGAAVAATLAATPPRLSRASSPSS